MRMTWDAGSGKARFRLGIWANGSAKFSGMAVVSGNGNEIDVKAGIKKHSVERPSAAGESG